MEMDWKFISSSASQAKSLGPLELDDESFQRLAVKSSIRRSQVDQVGIVGQERADARLSERLLKDVYLRAGKLPGSPLVGVLGEKLHRFTVMGLGRQESAMITAGNRHVSA